MKRPLFQFSIATLCLSFGVAAEGAPENQSVEQRFSDLALSCIHKEYPNIIKHMMTGDEQVKPPRELYPAFYGCFDWHSSVHGHWLLVRLLNSDAPGVDKALIIKKLSQSFTKANIEGEVAYFNRENTGTSFERPYGIAWFLQLTTELRQSKFLQAKGWLATLKPLEDKIIDNISIWLPKLSHPIRIGAHNQTAFAFGLMLDWSREAKNEPFEKLLISRIIDYYLNDKNCPLAYEPSGQDFLSPCIAEADLMRRVMPAKEYSHWLKDFLPTIPTNGSATWLKPVTVTDKADGKLAHLDGLNLSRAWMLEGMASALDITDSRRESIIKAAEHHKKAGIDAVVNDLHYMGSHWLGSFATYLQTKRGI